MNKIRLGILGAGRIVARVMTGLRKAQNIEITAIASRDLSRAREAAKRYDIPNAYGSYLELAESPIVDLVYIATPHPLHMEQAILMMNHGKHVLSEKPIVATASQLPPMIECAKKNGVFLMEAMWTRFMPAHIELMSLIRGGAIGEIRHAYAEFSWYDAEPDWDGRLYNPALAGGALLDLGVYPLMAITDIFGYEPEQVQAMACRTDKGIDMRTAVQLMFKGGATAQLMCGMDADAGNTMTVYGSKGYIEIPEFWHPTRFTLCRTGSEPEVYTYQPENEGHHYEFDHAAECINKGLTESPVVSLEESLAITGLCTRIRKDLGVCYPMD